MVCTNYARNRHKKMWLMLFTLGILARLKEMTIHYFI